MGSCSAITTVQVQDSLNNASPVAANTQVNLSGSATITFYANSNCTGALTSVTVQTGQSSAS